MTVSTGGVARYTVELAIALARSYQDDHYWLLSDQPFQMPQGSPANLHAGAGPRTPAERKWWLWGLGREMARHGIELFHGTDFAVPYLGQRPAVMTLHDLSPWLDPAWQPDAARVRQRTPRLLRWGLATMVITPSQAVRKQAIERFGLHPERVVAVPLAAREWFRPVRSPIPNIDPPSGPEQRPYFLFVGTLEPRKNISRLLEAWRAVRCEDAYRECDVDLLLAGRTRADFPQIEPEPGLRLLGAVADADLPGLYSGARAVVYPSLYEGFGLPVLEAMQCGALVITSRDPAIEEVTGGSAALHVDARDTHALAEAMRAAASSPEQFAGVKERALARAREFSWERTARLTREVYDAARRVFE
ncbi:MAG TPA: glycosyltransferase family 1 protein [Bryobacteraceae bacterium]|nr:glycosyltransferase family 1 protein [Bryobacteraceae bacterium]